MNKIFYLTLFAVLVGFNSIAQNDGLLTIDRIYNSAEFRSDFLSPIKWVDNGNAYIIYNRKDNNFLLYNIATQSETIYLTAKQLQPKGKDKPLRVEDFFLSNDESKLLIFNNSQRVWRSNTKGDYWVYDFDTKKLSQLGKQFEKGSLMFAKFSNNNKQVAYVQNFNLYVENFKTQKVEQLTTDGTNDIINGTFDWVYEEEFGCRDGFRWNNNGTHIAYWQVDASNIKDFYMVNNTDDVYAKMVPVQYPKVGELPAAVKVGIVNVKTAETTWIGIPGNPVEHYLPRLQWLNNKEVLIQQLNRKQNKLIYYVYNIKKKNIRNVYAETEDTWVDIKHPDVASTGWNMDDLPTLEDGKYFLKMTENDGWRHIYKVNFETGEKQLLTKGNYDVAEQYINNEDILYFNASPNNSTQRYLYSINLSNNTDSVRLTPKEFSGINRYNISPNGKYAIHSHTNANTPATWQLISLPNHKTINVLIDNKNLMTEMDSLKMPVTEFKSVTIYDSLEIDVKLIKPLNFDPSKKYPVLFYVYGEPAGQVALDRVNKLWQVMLAQMGYLVVTMDNRGTPCLKGSKWRKSIYRNIGRINAKDQAMAAKKVVQWPFVDADRVAVHGWSGGGSMTLNLLFQYPEIYKTGISVAPVANQLLYDNIYQERYMGLPSENKEDFVEGSPLYYAKNLEGNLLLIHGTGDDNVHYQNSEQLVDELIKHNKQFQVMPYPNRSHGIWEGKNTSRHLYSLMTNYLLQYCPILTE